MIKNMEEYKEDAIIVKKNVWDEINLKLQELATLQNRTAPLTIEMLESTMLRPNTYYTIKSFTINSPSNKIDIDCMDEFETKIDEFILAYNDLAVKYNENVELKTQLETFRNKWYHKLFNRNNH